MRRQHPTTLLFAFVLAASTACGGTADPTLTGDYVMDADAFAASIAEQLEGQLDEDTLETLREAEMDLTLATDGTFTCRQAVHGEEHAYRGTWTHGDDGRFVLDQTHEDGEEVSDRMAGKVVDGQLRLTHVDRGIRVRVILNKKS